MGAGFGRPLLGVGLGLGAALSAAPAQAGSIDFGSGASLDYLANLTYSLALRADDPDKRLTANVNGDDGDRNFDKGALINNRLAVLAETNFHYRNYGVFVRGSAFYDDVYFHKNDNDSPATVNRPGDHDQFTGSARDYLGKRARLLDAYAYGSLQLGTTALDLRVGNQVVSWGESLFFPNMSGAQAPADATKSNVPGTEVKEILLPTGQVYAQWGLTDRLSLMGYYQWEWDSTELNPVGGYFSTTDILGPGGQFLIVNLPVPPAPVPRVDVPRGRDLEPRDSGQWGAAARYRVGEATELSLYYINYHDKSPGGAQFNNPGFVDLLSGQSSYQVLYVDDIKMAALGLSTEIGGTAVGAEVSYRDGAGLSVNAPGLAGALGPTVTRGDVWQGNLNATKLLLPTALWDTLTVLGEVSYVHVADVDAIVVPASGLTPEARYGQLSNSRDAIAVQFLVQAGYKQVFSGWDLTLSFVNGYDVDGKSAINGALGSYTGKGDIRYSVGPSLKYLNNLELGLSYNGYAGGASVEQRPLADRSNIAFSAKYSF